MMKIAELAEGDFPLPESISASCRNFLEKCLHPDPSRRPSAAELKSHDWITNPPSINELQSIHVLKASGSDVDAGSVGTLQASQNPMQSLDADASSL